MPNFTSPPTGERLDKTVAGALPTFSRTQAQHLIQAGQVRVNGQVVLRPAFRLETTATIEVTALPPAPTAHLAENIPLDIVFEDADVLVINKPAGLVMHPAAGHASGTLVNAVLGYDPDLEGVGDEQRPGLVHRLDRDTSGLIVVAKNDRAHRHLQQQFQDRSVDKRYLALLDNLPPSPTGRIEAALGRDPHDRKRMALVPEDHGGRMAYTEYRVLETFAAGARWPTHTLVEAHLLTGRTHQLRVHFAFLKCPIVGDTVYGHAHPSLPLTRQFLHAARLTLQLPGLGATRVFEAPLPPDLQTVLALRRAKRDERKESGLTQSGLGVT